MYLSHWGLSRQPFLNDHDPEWWIGLPGSLSALGKLRYGAGQAGATLLTGDPGVGKSRVAHKLLDECRSEGWRAAYLPWSKVTASDLIHELAPDAGIPAPDGRSAFGRLAGLAVRWRAAGELTLAVVDDVDRAEPADLDLFAALMNVTHEGKPAIHLVLVGRAPVRELLSAAGLLERCAVVARAAPLGPADSRKYLLERLRLAGASRPVLTRSAADRIASYARGRMMDMNRLADLSLVAGYGMNAGKVTPDLVEMAAEDLGLEPNPDLEADASGLVQPMPPPFVPPEEDDVLASLSPGA